VTINPPDKNDVVVRQGRGNASTLYLLGTPAAPDQFALRTRDEAVARAIAYAKHQRVRAWFAMGNDEFVLLGTFLPEHRELARSSEWRSPHEERSTTRLSWWPMAQRSR
jgi:hypothetical protein